MRSTGAPDFSRAPRALDETRPGRPRRKQPSQLHLVADRALPVPCVHHGVVGRRMEVLDHEAARGALELTVAAGDLAGGDRRRNTFRVDRVVVEASEGSVELAASDDVGVEGDVILTAVVPAGDFA